MAGEKNGECMVRSCTRVDSPYAEVPYGGFQTLTRETLH